MAAVSFVAMSALLLGWFGLALVVPAGLVATALVLRQVEVPETSPGRAQRLADGTALVLALGFSLVNARYASQNLVVGRDPGIYADSGKWLVSHSSLVIDAHSGTFPAGLPAASAGFGYDLVPGHLFAQGSHLLPVLLGLVGRVFGDSVMLAANSLLGGLAVLAVYGFARGLVRPWLALLAVALLAISLPQIAFSRDTFTEPLSELLIFGGLALLWSARAGRRLGPHVVAGLTLGASALARPDALLVIPALLVAAVGFLLVAPQDRWRRTWAEVGCLLVPAAGTAGLGLLDLQQYSSGYYTDRRPELLQIGEFSVLVLAVGAVLLVLRRRSSVLVRLETATRRWRPVAGGVAVGALAVVLVSRPWWMTSRHSVVGPAAGYVAGLQRAAGQAVDPTRTYAEQSLTWVAWYLGPLALLLGLVGLALLLARCLRDEQLRLLPFLALFATGGLLYVLRPSIVPDHVWAMRRFLPVVLPGLAVAAVAVLEAWWVRRRPSALLAAVVVAALVLPTVYITYPLARVRQLTPQLAEVRRVCRALPRDAAVVVLGGFGNNYLQTLRSFCGVPAAGLVLPRPGQLGEVARDVESKHHRLCVLVAGTDLALAGPGPTPRPVSSVQVLVWNVSLVHPPRSASTVSRSLYLGQVGADGSVTVWLGSGA